jgi:protease-4
MKHAVVVAALVVAPAIAHAQSVERRYVDEPTAGLHLPTTPLAGDHDARALVLNPGGLQLLDGRSLVLAVDVVDEDAAAAAGQGVGLYYAGTTGGGLLPRFGYGVGVEALRPPRGQLDPDPGTPTRLSFGMSVPFGRSGGIGMTAHRFAGEALARGRWTSDLGVAYRFGNHAALGMVARDLSAPDIGVVEVQRRYELELTARPLGTDRLELGFGGRIGERRGDLDGWGRLSSRVARGVFVHAAAETRELVVLETTGAGTREIEDRVLTVSAGVEISFGALGAALWGSGRLDERGDRHVLGGTAIVRWSAKPQPAVQGHGQRIERIELTGGIGPREVTATVLRLRAIARDPAVRGVVLALDGVAAGWASMQELREEVKAVSRSGTKVFAYIVAASARDYYLASAADKIYLDPAGGVRLIGFAGTTLYFKGAFDKLGVAAQFEKIAEYKSAPEQYTEIAPTEPALRMRNELYDSLWESFLVGIAEGRRLDRKTVEELVDGGPYTAGQLERDHRLVDAVATPERVAELIAIELGGLAPVAEAPVEKDDRWKRPAIALIYADGDIVDGKSMTIPFLGRKLVGSETISSLIAAARESPEVGAIVIRIDSPGGSALASEVMSREVFKTRGRKPIICSMGDVAASGGYFLAAGCDVIFAEPMTITGSIGIFYGKFDLSGLMDKLGVTSETFRRGRRADMESMYRPYTEEERIVLHDRLTYFYGRFTDAVARGRGMTQTKVDEIGRGHVWSGTQAKGIGLVDRLGGVADAITLAKERMGLGPDDKVRVIALPRPSGGLLSWLGLAGARAREPSLGLGDLPAAKALLDGIPASILVDPDAAQARLPYDIVWE